MFGPLIKVYVSETTGGQKKQQVSAGSATGPVGPRHSGRRHIDNNKVVGPEWVNVLEMSV